MGSCVVSLVQKEGITRLKTTLLVNDYSIELNEFTSNYIGEIIHGVVRALGKNDDKMSVEIDEKGLRIFTSNEEIPLVKEFVRNLIESTVKGVLSPLKGIFWLQKITISVEAT